MRIRISILSAFDNYLPLSDWTTGGGGLDALYWDAPAPASWPPGTAEMNGSAFPARRRSTAIDYLKANIEGGEKFNWFYNDGTNAGRGLDPNGTDLRVSLPAGDRLTQSRNPYYPQQQLLANKQVRWWWNNPHQAIYDVATAMAGRRTGPITEWVPQSKSDHLR